MVICMNKETKVCICCKIDKEIHCFSKKNNTNDGYHYYCRLCRNSKAKEFRKNNKDNLSKKEKIKYEKNKERIKLRVNKYRRKNIEAIKQKQKIYYKKYKDGIRLKAKQHYANNKYEFAVRSSKYRATNKQRILAQQKAWREKNKDYVLNNVRRRRARQNNAQGDTSPNIKQILFLRQKGYCPICRNRLPKESNKRHLDHIMPLVLGGDNTDYNVQLLCCKCNLQKNKLDPIEFMQTRGFLL